MLNLTAINDLDRTFLVNFQKFLSSPSLDWFFPAITDLHLQKWFLIFILLPSLSLWFWRHRQKAFLQFIVLLFTVALVDSFCGQLIKKVFARPRPFATVADVIQKSPASGYSFVSNHAANAFAVAVFFSVLYPRTRFFWFTCAFLVSVSRLYNGVHYLSDVIAGAFIGAMISFFVASGLKQKLKVKAQ